MSKNLDINGVRFESCASIAQRFGYTSDYVSRLAREEKIDATRVGRLWFIDPVSVEKFKELSEQNKNTRSEELKIQRHQERSAQIKENKKLSSLERTEVYVAMAQTTAVVMCGLLVGSLGWMVSSQEVQVAQVFQGAVSVYSQIQDGVLYDTQTASLATVSVTAGDSGVLKNEKNAPEISSTEGDDVEASDSVITGSKTKNLFSDTVDIVYTADGAQIVRPIFKDDLTGRAYMMVVNERNISSE